MSVQCSVVSGCRRPGEFLTTSSAESERVESCDRASSQISFYLGAGRVSPGRLPRPGVLLSYVYIIPGPALWQLWLWHPVTEWYHSWSCRWLYLYTIMLLCGRRMRDTEWERRVRIGWEMRATLWGNKTLTCARYHGAWPSLLLVRLWMWVVLLRKCKVIIYSSFSKVTASGVEMKCLYLYQLDLTRVSLSFVKPGSFLNAVQWTSQSLSWNVRFQWTQISNPSINMKVGHSQFVTLNIWHCLLLSAHHCIIDCW